MKQKDRKVAERREAGSMFIEIDTSRVSKMLPDLRGHDDGSGYLGWCEYAMETEDGGGILCKAYAQFAQVRPGIYKLLSALEWRVNERLSVHQPAGRVEWAGETLRRNLERDMRTHAAQAGWVPHDRGYHGACWTRGR